MGGGSQGGALLPSTQVMRQETVVGWGAQQQRRQDLPILNTLSVAPRADSTWRKCHVVMRL